LRFRLSPVSESRVDADEVGTMMPVAADVDDCCCADDEVSLEVDDGDVDADVLDDSAVVAAVLVVVGVLVCSVSNKYGNAMMTTPASNAMITMAPASLE
jgi:hypothetical protein